MSLDVLYLAWNRLEFTQLTFELLLANTDWSLVDRLLIYDDGSDDGTREYLEDAMQRCPVEHHVIHLGWNSPVAVMNHYVGRSQAADVFAKIDNDIAVPPGWLNSMIGVIERNPKLELLGMEAGQTRLAGRDGEPWDGVYGYRECSHIGGVGLMRTSAFRQRSSPVAKGRFGFTQWQHTFEPMRGWIEPDLLVPQLDRVPTEPWRTYSLYYLARGWQRPWAPMDDTFSAAYYDWLLPFSHKDMRT